MIVVYRYVDLLNESSITRTGALMICQKLCRISMEISLIDSTVSQFLKVYNTVVLFCVKEKGFGGGRWLFAAGVQICS